MRGDERVRFCDECKLNVYNISELTRAQAKTLIAKHEGRLCVRYYQRTDGTVITQDCQGGVRRAMQRTRRLVTAAAGAVLCAVLAPFGFAWNVPVKNDPPPTGAGCALPVAGRMVMGKPAPQQREVKGEVAIMGDIAPLPQQPQQPQVIMGVVAPRPPATQPSTQPVDQPTTQPAQ
jgi:hypothetical protein